MAHIKHESALFSKEQLDLFNKRLMELFVECDDDETNDVNMIQFTKLMKRVIPNPNESDIETLFNTIDVEKTGKINYKNLLKDNKFTLFLLNSIMIKQTMNNNYTGNGIDKSVIHSKRHSISYSNTEIEHTVLDDDDDYKFLNHFPNNTHFGRNDEIINEYKNALTNTKKELTELELKYENMEIEYNDNKNRLNELMDYETKYNDLMSEYSIANEMNKTYKLKMDEYTFEKENYESEIKRLKGELNVAKTTLNETMMHENLLTKSYSEINDIETKLNDENIILKKQLTQVQTSSTHTMKQYEEITQLNEQLMIKVDELTKRELKYKSDIETFKKDKETMQKTINDKINENNEYINTIEDVRAQYTLTLKELNDIKAINSTVHGVQNSDGVMLDHAKMKPFDKTLRGTSATNILFNTNSSNNLLKPGNTNRASNMSQGTFRSDYDGGTFRDPKIYHDFNNDEYHVVDDHSDGGDSYDHEHDTYFWGNNNTTTPGNNTITPANNNNNDDTKGNIEEPNNGNIEERIGTNSDKASLRDQIVKLQYDVASWKKKAEAKQRAFEELQAAKDKKESSGCVLFNFALF